MKFANVVINDRKEVVVFTSKGLFNLSAISQISQNFVPLFKNTDELIRSNFDIDKIDQVITDNHEELKNKKIPTEYHFRFLPCIENPSKIICVGLNYRRHAMEEGTAIPKEPVLFGKFNNTLAGNLERIKIPAESKEMDYEGEMGLVIGKECSHVSSKDALNYVYGYFVANDVSARDLQFKSSQWLLGKSLDKFAPIGPWVVTADEVKDPDSLQLRTFVNDELRQNSNTSDMIFNTMELVSYISKFFTLYPNDIILTGTPEGVIQGMPEDKRVWLRRGDKVVVEIEQLGKLENTFI